MKRVKRATGPKLSDYGLRRGQEATVHTTFFWQGNPVIPAGTILTIDSIASPASWSNGEDIIECILSDPDPFSDSIFWYVPASHIIHDAEDL